MMLDQSSQTI